MCFLAMLYVTHLLVVTLIFEALRDWLDARTCVHVLAIAIAFVGSSPPLLLPLDASGTVSERLYLADLYLLACVSALSMLFGVAPGAFVITTPARRGRSCRVVCAVLGGAGACGALGLVSPVLAVSRGAAIQVAYTLRHELEGPLALILLLGGLTLATHAAWGALALPSLLAPSGPLDELNELGAAQIGLLRRALAQTRERLRKLDIQYVLPGRRMSRADQERHAMMMRDERRMGAQLTNLEQGETGCASRLSRALLCRRLGAALLLPPALLYAGSLTLALAQQAALSPCGWRCGFLVPLTSVHEPTHAPSPLPSPSPPPPPPPPDVYAVHEPVQHWSAPLFGDWSQPDTTGREPIWTHNGASAALIGDKDSALQDAWSAGRSDGGAAVTPLAHWYDDDGSDLSTSPLSATASGADAVHGGDAAGTYGETHPYDGHADSERDANPYGDGNLLAVNYGGKGRQMTSNGSMSPMPRPSPPSSPPTPSSPPPAPSPPPSPSPPPPPPSPPPLLPIMDAATPMDAMLLAMSRMPPLDDLAVALLILLVVCWVVVATHATNPPAAGTLWQPRGADDGGAGVPIEEVDALAGAGNDEEALSVAGAGSSSNVLGLEDRSTRRGSSANGQSAAQRSGGGGGGGGGCNRSVRLHGTSASDLLWLALRLSVAALAFGATLITVAPSWALSPDASLAGTTLRLMMRHLPYFGIAWYSVQALIALSFITQISWRCVHVLLDVTCWSISAVCGRDSGPSEDEFAGGHKPHRFGVETPPFTPPSERTPLKAAPRKSSGKRAECASCGRSKRTSFRELPSEGVNEVEQSATRSV